MPMNQGNNRLSPLDQIRHAEAEVTRRIAAARMEAKRIVADAKDRSAEELQNAIDKGQREGETSYTQILSEASEEAEAILLQAKNRSNQITQRGQVRMEYALRCAINLITGQKEGDHRL